MHVRFIYRNVYMYTRMSHHIGHSLESIKNVYQSVTWKILLNKELCDLLFDYITWQLTFKVWLSIRNTLVNLYILKLKLWKKKNRIKVVTMPIKTVTYVQRIEKQVSLSWLYKPSTLTNKWDAEVWRCDEFWSSWPKLDNVRVNYSHYWKKKIGARSGSEVL